MIGYGAARSRYGIRRVSRYGYVSAFGDIDPNDSAAINKALQYMDAALVEAQSILASNSGLWSSITSTVTGTNNSAIKTEVDTFAKAAQSMHDTATRLLGNPNTTHDRIIDFVRGCVEISNITALKDSTNRNSLVKLLSDVGAATVKDLGTVAKVSFGVTKWLVVGAVAVGAIIYAPELKALFGFTRRSRSRT